MGQERLVGGCAASAGFVQGDLVSEDGQGAAQEANGAVGVVARAAALDQPGPTLQVVPG